MKWQGGTVDDLLGIGINRLTCATGACRRWRLGPMVRDSWIGMTLIYSAIGTLKVNARAAGPARVHRQRRQDVDACPASGLEGRRPGGLARPPELSPGFVPAGSQELGRVLGPASYRQDQQPVGPPRSPPKPTVAL